jgi:hypothetical protein
MENSLIQKMNIIGDILDFPKDILICLQLRFLNPVSSFKFSSTCKYLYELYIWNVQLKFKIYYKYICLTWWNNGLYKSCHNNNYNVIQYFIERGVNDWNKALYYAAKRGYLHLIEFFIKKGAINLNPGMYGAAKGGHLDLV